jgi:hypothetical protein
MMLAGTTYQKSGAFYIACNGLLSTAISASEAGQAEAFAPSNMGRGSQDAKDVLPATGNA